MFLVTWTLNTGTTMLKLRAKLMIHAAQLGAERRVLFGSVQKQGNGT